MANLSSKTGTVTTPVQAQISLANNAATSVQDMSAYQAQEVTGFVYVDASSDLRCSFKVMVVKNGADVFEIAAVDLAGDDYSGAPLLSFSMSGSVLRVTLPNVTGFTSAYLRYQLSAPYLGGNYPLSVSASQVAGSISGAAIPGYIGEVFSSVANASVTQTGTSSADVLFNTAGAPLLTLNKGIYLITGSTGICTTSGAADEVGLWIYNVTTSAGINAPAIGYAQNNDMRPFSVTTIVTIAADSTQIRLFGQRSGASVIKLGGTNGVIKSAFLQAVRVG